MSYERKHYCFVQIILLCKINNCIYLQTYETTPFCFDIDLGQKAEHVMSMVVGNCTQGRKHEWASARTSAMTHQRVPGGGQLHPRPRARVSVRTHFGNDSPTRPRWWATAPKAARLSWNAWLAWVSDGATDQLIVVSCGFQSFLAVSLHPYFMHLYFQNLHFFCFS